MTDFVLQTKSTLDKIGTDLATALSVSYVDLDDTVNVSDVLTNESSALLMRFVNMDEAPRDPLYTLTFTMGIKTVSDPSNYSLLTMISQVKKQFEQGSSIDIYDYSEVTPPTVVKGSMMFVESGVDQQVMDRMSGARLLTVIAKCNRYV